MNYITNNFIFLRNLIISNFFINILAFQYKDSIIDTNNIYYLLLLLRVIPFFILNYILTLFNINIIYQKEGIYDITNNKLKILPIILKMIIKCDTSYEIDNIKYYNSNIPIEFLLNNYKCLENNKISSKIYVKYLIKGKVIEKEININENNIIKPLYVLFE